MHTDDLVAAQLLGHSGTGSLRFYRRIGDDRLAEESKGMRDAMDGRLAEILSGWDE